MCSQGAARLSQSEQQVWSEHRKVKGKLGAMRLAARLGWSAILGSTCVPF